MKLGTCSLMGVRIVFGRPGRRVLSVEVVVAEEPVSVRLVERYRCAAETRRGAEAAIQRPDTEGQGMFQ
jgi:hypothetical protein